MVNGGFGSSVAEYFHSCQYSSNVPNIIMLGVPDNFITHGTVPQLKKICGFDVDGIVSAALKLFQKGSC